MAKQKKKKAYTRELSLQFPAARLPPKPAFIPPSDLPPYNPLDDPECRVRCTKLKEMSINLKKHK
jgi:hypothetical protein